MTATSKKGRPGLRGESKARREKGACLPSDVSQIKKRRGYSIGLAINAKEKGGGAQILKEGRRVNVKGRKV